MQNDLAASPPFILSASPRTGNSDAVARLFLSILTGHAGYARSQATFLRQYHILSCVNCGSCRKDAAAPCPLEQRDDSSGLFARLLSAPLVCFIAPIYFYHLPAHFKALIDRSQLYYSRREAGLPLGPERSPQARQARVILLAGRERGDNLFSGSLLTLKYFLDALGMTMAEPLLLRGLEGPDSLAARPELYASVLDYARASIL